MNDDDVDDLLRGWGVNARQTTTPAPVNPRRFDDRRTDRHRTAILAAVLITVLIAAAASVLGLQHRDDSATASSALPTPSAPSQSTPRSASPASPTPTVPASVAAALKSELKYLTQGSEVPPRGFRFAKTTQRSFELFDHSHDGHADPNMPIYILAAEGSFAASRFPGGGGRPAPGQPTAPATRSRFLIAALDAKTLDLRFLGLRESTPDLSLFGPFAPLP